MKWERSRYGLPVIVYHWAAGVLGLIILLYCSIHPPFPEQQIDMLAFLIFLTMHVIASFLHFQYARLNVVITFESSFTTATLLVFGALPAVWVSVAGIVFGSCKRVIERRFILRKTIPLAYDLGIIVFNSGMVGAMWLAASWVYLALLKGPLPLTHLQFTNIASILLMFVSLSLINHLILFVSSYMQGQDPIVFVRKALFPAFITELATIPFGVVMALSFTRMGSLAFFFLAATLLLSNAVLRNLSIIRYDQEEKLRQLNSLNAISRQIIAMRDEDSVIRLLFENAGKIVETNNLFVAVMDERPGELRFLNAAPTVFQSIGRSVVESHRPMLIKHSRRDAPAEWTEDLANEGIRSCIVLPMLTGERTYGVLGVYSKEYSAFKMEHMQVLTMIADEAAMAMDSSRLYSDLLEKVAELESLNKELRQLDRLKSEFLANVSHELRTPLTSIKGYVEYIRKEKLGPITPLQNEGLTVAQRNILRLQRLINDLLDYTRLEYKRSPLSLTPCTLTGICNEAIEEFADTITKKRLTLKIMIPSDLPMLLVDLQRMIQVIGNLLSNSIKFTGDDGSIWLEAQVLSRQESFYRHEAYAGKCMPETLIPVQISIRDSGIGIPPDALDKIFERFYQVDSSHTRKYGGTGLGLAIVKSILDAHGISYHVESVLGTGTSFIMIVPAVPSTDLRTALKITGLSEHTMPRV